MAEVSLGFPENLPDAATLLVCSQRLAALPEAEREAVFQTLFKLVDAVLGAPEDPKKRTVRKANATFHEKVGRHAPAVDFLRGCGFLDADDPDVEGEQGRKALLSMRVAYLARLTDAHHTLARAAQQAGLPAPPLPSAPGFNPYQSSASAVDSTRSAKAPDAWKSEADRVRDEVRKRQLDIKEKVESAPPVELKPTAFWASAGRRLEEVIRETAQEQVEEAGQTGDSALLQTQVAAVAQAVAGTSKFESADKRRLAALSRTKVHETCILRVTCPDKSVLQVQFRAADRGDYVLSQIEPLLAPHVRSASWYIYQSPPMKRLAARETLFNAGLTPGANMYLGFEGEKPRGPFLEDSLVAQLGPAPEERGVTGHSFSGEAMGWGVGKKLGAASAAGSSSGGDAGGAAASSAGSPNDGSAAAGAASPPSKMED